MSNVNFVKSCKQTQISTGIRLGKFRQESKSGLPMFGDRFSQ
jgi:hypothetical protein